MRQLVQVGDLVEVDVLRTLLFLFLSSLYSLGLQAETLTLWNGHSLEHLEPELRRFQAQSGHQVLQQHFRADQFRDKVISSILLPDLYFIPSDQLSNKQEYHLGQWPASLAQKHGLREDGKFKGAWYGIPINMGNQLVLYYRKDKVKALDELTDIPAGRLAWPADQAFWFIPFLTAQGGWPLNGRHFTLNTPEMVAALESYQQAVARNPATKCELMCNEHAFLRGEVDYLIDGDWAYQMLHEVIGEKLGVALLPKVGGKQMKPLSSSYVLAIRDDLSPAKRAIAEKLVTFLLSDDAQRRLYERSKLFPAVAAVGSKMNAHMSPDMRVLHTQLQQSLAMPNDRNMLVVWLVMGKGLHLFLDGEYDAKEAAEYMQSLAEEGK
ncbi:MAG: sugar ABC transporter substrate-binding protein [Aeromonadaceae bacterium]